MTTRDKLFGFRGRVRRYDWWVLGILLGLAQLILAFAIISAVSVMNLASSAPPVAPFEALAALPVYVTLPIQLAFLWPNVALSVQRRHDRNGSAWPVLAWFAVIYGVDYIPASATAWTSALEPALQQGLSLAWGAIYIAMSLWFLITLGFLDGTPGPNRYGPSPKADERAAPAL